MSDRSVSRQSTQNSKIDIEDQFLFFALFGVGAAAIWSLKLLGLNQWIVTAIPVALMGFYAAVALITKRYRIREDRVGDNIYYLGFLYTLTSLSYALYIYDPDGSGATAIITNFGIAILTTIIGLAGRVFFNQMRVDPVEYEREARFSLAQASNELRANLADITIEVSNFKRKTFQILEEGAADMSNTARASLEANISRFTETSNEVIENIRTAFSSFTDHAGRLNEIASKNVNALQALFERIEKIEASPELLATKLDPVMEKFAEVANETMRRNRAQTDDLKRIRDIVDVATSATEALQKSVGQADRAILEKVETLTKNLTENAAAATRFSESITNATSTLARELVTSREIAAALDAGATAHLKTITEVRAAIEADLQIARQHRDVTARMVKESRDALQEVEQALVSLSRSLVEQLGGH